MINEYYGNASTPNDSFLMHYGVKGMKWGVIRKKLSDVKYGARRKHAEAKMKRLERNADLGVQQKRLNRNLKIAGAGLGTSMASLGAHSLQKVMSSKKLLNSSKNLANARIAEEQGRKLRDTAYNNWKTAANKQPRIPHHNLRNKYSTANKEWWAAKNAFDDTTREHKALTDKIDSGISKSKKLSYGIAGAGLGVAGVAAGRAALAAYRSSKRGHAKAVAKRDAYRKEMNQRYGKRRSRSRS